jgi:exodeoxyribonuclease V alpha subunit
MNDVELSYRLTAALDTAHTHVVFVGDKNQLPPVGAGAFLRDVLATDSLPITELHQVMRQAGVLRANSLAVLDGELAKTARDDDSMLHEQRTSWHVLNNHQNVGRIPGVLEQLWQEIIPDKLGYTGTQRLRDVQILTPTHQGPLGTKALNVFIQRLVHGDDRIEAAWRVGGFGKRQPLLIGDKVVWTRNDYDLDVFNGQIGVIEDRTTITNDDGKPVDALAIRFDRRVVRVPKAKWDRLQLAYALTVHKAQGSEWPCVIVICHKAHSFQHHRNWLYTAVTRAARACILIGDAWGMKHCAQTVQADKRRSFLAHWLK